MYNLNLNDFADMDSAAMIFYTDFNKKEILLYEAWYSRTAERRQEYTF